MRDYTKRRPSEEKERLIDENIEYIGRVMSALQEMKSGHAETYACRKYGLNQSQFRCMMRRTRKEPEPYIDRQWAEGFIHGGSEPNAATWPLLSWQERFFLILLDTQMGYEQIPPDIDETVPIVLEKIDEKHAKEKAVIESHFRDEMPLREIAEKQGVTVARIREIYGNGMRRIYADPFARRILTLGKEWYDAAEKARAEADMNNTEKGRQIMEFKRKAEFAKLRHDAAMLTKIRDGCDRELKNIREDVAGADEWDAPLESLDLPRRTLLLLKKAGFSCISEFVGKSRREMQDVSHIGKKALKKLEAELIEHGIMLA